jgi:hypothetical protein
MDEAEAVELVKARLREIGTPGRSYQVVDAREHTPIWPAGAQVWQVSVQEMLPNGQPTYDQMVFDVDKVTKEVRQMV